MEECMKPILKACILIASILLLSACEVVCVNPLSKPNHPKGDNRLIGKWRAVGDGSGEYIQFDKGARFGTDVSFFDLEPTSEDKNPRLTFFTTRIQDFDYMNIVSNNPKDAKGYLIARYRLKNGRLTVWLMNYDKVKEEIGKGKLKGSWRGMFGTITLTDSSQSLVDLIRSGGEDLFEYLGEFEKATDK
jgi:hypothetical protein